MKKSIVSIFGFILLSLVPFAFTSCETGLGEEVDLEAPVLTITSPDKFSYQPLNFVLTGTCTDNKAVTSVVISNKETGRVYGNATINGNTWTYNMHLSKAEEGEITFVCSANDAFGNTSTKSSRNITLLVDENPPEGGGWYVERGNNKQTGLKDKEFLENLDFTLSVNKDIPQNEIMYIHASFYDAMNIDTITLKLFDEEISTVNPIIEKTINVNNLQEGQSIYSPVFIFTHSELTAAGLDNNPHYLRVKYYSKDNDDPVNFNEDETDTEGYVLWYPDSDKPGIQLNNLEFAGPDDEIGEITVSVGSSIPLDFFDDDAVKEIRYALRNSITGTCQQYAASLISNSSTRDSAFTTNTENQPAKITTISSDTQQESHPSIKAPPIPCQMYLLTAAKDINGKWNARVVPVKVTDTNKPLLFIESPSQNTIPDIDEGQTTKFSFKGYSLDTKGSDFVKIIYIPDDPAANADNSAEAKATRAENLFKKYATNTTTKIIEETTKEVIWHKTLQTGSNSSGWNKQSFSIQMDLENDFKNKNGTSTAKDDKYFAIYLRDSDGNDVNKPFLILGDSSAPTVNITGPETQLAVYDYDKDSLKLEFWGEKSTGLGIDETKYKVKTKIGAQTYEWNTTKADPYKLSIINKTLNNGTPDDTSDDTVVRAATATVSKDVLKTWQKTEPQPTFKFYAMDKLGNGGEDENGDGQGERTIILTTSPYIKSISVDKPEGSYITGETLTFKVTFSQQVKATGTPKLILKLSDNVTREAAWDTTGSGSDTLQFKYTVQSGDSSSKLECNGFKTKIVDNKLVLDDGTIRATELGEHDIKIEIPSGATLFSTTKTIKLDGIAPRINSIEVSAEDGNNSCKAGKVINATVLFNENVRIESTPELKLRVGTSTIKFNFANWNDNSITFTHVVNSTGEPQGEISYDSTKFISDNAGLVNAIKDNSGAGNNLTLSGYTPGYTSGVSIDTVKPTTYPAHNLTASSYNEAQTLELSGYGTDTAYYSLDGGLSWNEYKPTEPTESTEPTGKPKLGDGTYTIKTYQEDAAGNKGPESTAKTVTIKGSFPTVTGFTLDASDGYYSAGSTIDFTLSFSDNIKVSSTNAVKLTFEDFNDSTKTKTVNVTVPSGNKGSTLKFKTTVGTTDEFKGVKLTKIKFDSTVEDEYGNKPSFATIADELTPDNCTYLAAQDGGARSGVVLDGVAPAITIYSPENNGISSTTDNSSGSFTITLTFSEDVAKETGTIILQRKGQWAIPAVMENDEFLKYYNKMSAANKAIVRRMGADGDDLKHGRTGIEVGPYRRTTHGLIKDGSYYIPDTSTKFVLAYDLGLYEGSAALNDGTETGTFTVTVAQIRAALESVGYHQHKVDVASEFVKITGNKVEITFSEKIEDGREWELIIPDTAFRDDAENFYKGMNITGSTDTYSMWSNNVAQPVIRVDRYTHGWGAKEPNSDGSFTTITVNQGKYKDANPANNTAAKIAPTGYARARIDCETPGAAIEYSKLGINGTAWTTTAPAGVAYNATGGTNYTFDNDGIATTTGNNNNKYTRQVLDDITTTAINKRGEQSYTQGADIIIGDGNYTAARKDYITAYATKSGYTDSVNGYEGVFKTIVYYTAGAQTRIINVEGGTAPGGQACVFGFPLKDATDENDPTNAGRYSKNCYAVNGNTRTQWAFVSYEIMSKDWAILLCNGNHSRIYPLNSYGGATYITAMNYW